jgi:hypothetical protein
MSPLLDPVRLDELIHDVGLEVLMILMEDFLATDYETPLHTLSVQRAEARRDCLHGLKGVAANMGALSLFLLSRDLMKQTCLTEKDQDHIIAVLLETRQAMNEWINNAPPPDPETDEPDENRSAGGFL